MSEPTALPAVPQPQPILLYPFPECTDIKQILECMVLLWHSTVENVLAPFPVTLSLILSVPKLFKKILGVTEM